MSLILYGAPLSPFVRKVRLTLLEKNIEFQLENVLPFTPPDWFYAISPLGRVPALRDGELTLADSAVICQYLEEQYPQHLSLCGQTPAERAQVRWLEKYADYEIAPGATGAVFFNRIVRRSAGHDSDEDAVRNAVDMSLPRHFDYLEGQLGHRAFFVGDRLSIADLAIASQLINMQYGGEPVSAQHWPALAAHLQRMQQRPSIQAAAAHEQKLLGKILPKG